MLSECCIFKIFHVQYDSGHCLAFCVFLYKRIELPHREQIMEADSLPVEPACFFSFLLSYICLYLKKIKSPLLENTSIYGELYH